MNSAVTMSFDRLSALDADADQVGTAGTSEAADLVVCCFFFCCAFFFLAFSLATYGRVATLRVHRIDRAELARSYEPGPGDQPMNPNLGTLSL